MTKKPTLLNRSIHYALFPEIIPRVKNFGFNFGYLAYLVAYLFSITGLFTRGHPYLKSENMGRFGIRDVMLEAYGNLTWSWRRADQIVIFFLVSAAFMVVLAQVAIFFIFVLSYSKDALAIGVNSFFQTTPPDYDMAFMMLDRVFGIPNFFDSCINQAIPCGPNVPARPPIPWPMHDGLHIMLRLYSEAMLYIGLFIVLYYIFVVFAETAQTGTPFGQRFASVYAPMRLILAIVLLLPLANGINSGQYIMLYAAKWGSSFGTNGWKVFNADLTNTLGLRADNLVVKANSPDVKTIVQFYHIAVSCKAIYEDAYGRTIAPYFGDGTPANGVNFNTALANFADQKVIQIKYGEQDTVKHHEYPNGIKPYCGEIVMPLEAIDTPYSLSIYAAYYSLLVSLWNDGNLNAVAAKTAAMRLSTLDYPDPLGCPVLGGGIAWTCNDKPPTAYLSNSIQNTQALLDATLETTLDPANVGAYLGFDYDAETIGLGWGGAGLWFNKISSVNGGVITAIFSKPHGNRMPEIMEFVAKQKSKKFPGLTLFDKYTPSFPKNDKKQLTFDWEDNPDLDGAIAGYLADIHKSFLDDEVDPTPDVGDTSNVIGTVLSAIFGAQGLMDLRENNEVHPMAQMAGLGKSIIESAIQNIGIGLALSFGAGAASQSNNLDTKYAGNLMDSKGGVLISIGTLALTTGFLLYYILPFLPFIYFFFAVGKWVKAIFEAMVAIPLWALAHLKIDGDGISGAAAKNGYILILEIFLRPILTVFGLIVAIASFSAMAVMMNELFDLAIANLSGYDSSVTPGTYIPGQGGAAPTFFEVEYYRSGVDQFFFTLLYAVLIYVLAMACFKLIDLIPNSILRWIGEGVESFGDKAEDAADNLVRYAAIGGGVLGGQLTGSLKDGAKFMGQGGGTIMSFK